jgi:hypothetical protein
MGYEKYEIQGYQVLNSFKKYFPTPLTSDEIASEAQAFNPKLFIGQLGFRVAVGLQGDSLKANEAMRDLALRVDRVPTASTFYDALRAQEESNFSYVAKYAYEESTKEFAEIADDGVKALSSLSDVVKLVIKFAPILLIGGIYVYYKRNEQ